MNIAFITPSLGYGGKERVLSKLINYCHSMGDTVHVIMYAKERVVCFPIDGEIKIHIPDFDFKKNETIFAIKSLRFIRKTVKDNKIDTIVSFEEKWNRFALLALVGVKVRRVISNRNNPYRYYGFIDDKLAKWLYPQVDVLVAQTKIAKETYEKRYRLKKCVVIGNPIDQIDYNEDDLERENIVVCVARLMISKNHDRLVNIFSKTKNEGWKLVLVGGAFGKEDLSIKLKKQVAELGLDDRVVFAGASKDVNSFLLKSKIFAFTSDHEGFPNSIGEAMAAGLPVVSYDCVAGPSDMIDDGISGYLVPVFDDDLFVKRLNYLMTHESERREMGEAAKEKIKQFDTEQICTKFYNIIKG